MKSRQGIDMAEDQVFNCEDCTECPFLNSDHYRQKYNCSYYDQPLNGRYDDRQGCALVSRLKYCKVTGVIVQLKED